MDGDVLDTDMELYFGNENLPEPVLAHIPAGVDGTGAPFDPNADSFESTLDVQQSGGMAPRGRQIWHATGRGRFSRSRPAAGAAAPPLV